MSATFAKVSHENPQFIYEDNRDLQLDMFLYFIDGKENWPIQNAIGIVYLGKSVFNTLKVCYVYDGQKGD